MPSPLPRLCACVFLFLPAGLAIGAEPPAAVSKAARAAQGETGVFGLTRLHRIGISVSRQEWLVLQNETQTRTFSAGVPSELNDIVRSDGRVIHIGGGFGNTFPWVHADVTFNGVVAKDSGLRYKGNGSYNPAAGLHRNLKIKTDFFKGTGRWQNLETINLNSGGRDPSRMRESLAYAIFRAAGVPAPRTAFAEVFFTVPELHAEAYGGLFTVIENVNKSFLKDVLPPGNGLLMKPERMDRGVGYYGELWDSYVPFYRPEREATPQEQARVIEFARLVNQPLVPEFRARIGSILDVDAFLRFLAVHALIVGRDSFLAGRHNYFIYLDPSDNRFRFIPWDEDSSMNGSNSSMSLLMPYSGDNPLAHWLLDDPAVLARYKAIVREIVDTIFNRPELNRLVALLEPVVAGPLAREGAAMAQRMETNSGRAGGAPDLRAFLETRMLDVQRQMSAW